MCRLSAVLLFAFVAQAPAGELMTIRVGKSYVDKLVDTLIGQVLDNLLLHRADLDDVALAKSGLLAVDPCTLAAISRNDMSPSHVRSARFHRRCGTSCATQGSDDSKPLPCTTHTLGRREAGLALTFASLVGAEARPAAALNQRELAIIEAQSVLDRPGYLDGVGGLKYRDTVVGKGEEAGIMGDLFTVDYVLSLPDSGQIVERQKDFKFQVGDLLIGLDLALAGARKIQKSEIIIPPMKVGGTRKVILPPKLAYLDKGVRCAPNGNRCAIPPYSSIEFEITLKSIKRDQPISKEVLFQELERRGMTRAKPQIPRPYTLPSAALGIR